MANRFQLDLKTFELSSRHFDLSLSMTSVAFIYDIPIHNIASSDLSFLIQSKQLWLLPRGLCRLDMHVQLGEGDIWWEARDEFFKFIADTVCRSSIWSQLGIGVHILDIQPHQAEKSVPNLYFSIEQPDMSSALLSPPYSHTAQFKGLECILRFEAPSRSETGLDKGATANPVPPFSSSRVRSLTQAPIGHSISYDLALVDLWENAAYLVEGALGLTIGVRKRMRGLTIFEPEKAPSLLDLAPAICNSRYLKSAVTHTKHFAVISNILASSLNGQSPILRRKAAGLLKDNVAESYKDGDLDTEPSAKQLEPSIQRKLWDLLQDTIKPTIRANGTTQKETPTKGRLNNQDYGIDATMTFNQYDSWDEQPCYYENMVSLPSQGYDHDDYQIGTGCDLDLEYEWQKNSSPDIYLPEYRESVVPNSQDGTGHFYDEADISDDQFFEPHNPHPKLDLPHTIENQAYGDYIYGENDGSSSYEGEYAGLLGQQNSAVYGTAATAAWCTDYENGDYEKAMEGNHGDEGDLW